MTDRLEKDNLSAFIPRVQYEVTSNLPINQKNLLSQFVDRIKSTFSRQNRGEEQSLNGRIQQFNQTALSVLQKLNFIKQELKINIDPELVLIVEKLLDPMSREALSIQKMLGKPSNAVQDAKTYQKYSNWMTKAMVWVDLENKVNDPQAVFQAIINHIFHEADDLIEQDLQVVQDYEMHIMDNLPLGEEEGNQIKKQLEKELQPCIRGLRALKQKPSNTNLQSVFDWKDQLDRHRSLYFETALQIIDRIIGGYAPTSTSSEEHEYLVDVLSQMAYLEDEIPEVLAEYAELTDEDRGRREMLLSRLDTFAEELHVLNLDLRLTPELYERVQHLMDQLRNR